MVCLRNRKEGNSTSAKSVREDKVANKVGMLASRQVMLGLIGHMKNLDFVLGVMGSYCKVLNVIIT